MRFFLFSCCAIFLLHHSTAIAADDQQNDKPAETKSSFNAAYDSFTALLTELADKFGNLTSENKQTLNDVSTDIKNILNDQNPAAGVTVEGNTKKQWDDFNTSSPELDEKNKKLEEENLQRIKNM